MINPDPVLSIRQGDITTYDGDAIVNAANNHLILGAGVAGAIRNRGGPAIQQECNARDPIRVGEAAITGAGELGVRHVIHAAAMGDEPVSERSIRESTRRSLELAREHGLKRIAFPVLGSGIGGFDFRTAAGIMLEEIKSAARDGGFEEIVLYGYTENDRIALEEVLARGD